MNRIEYAISQFRRRWAPSNCTTPIGVLTDKIERRMMARMAIRQAKKERNNA